MREEDARVPFYKKTQNMREMHKNRQDSVEIIRHILFEEGMDAREMKKQILYDALYRYQDSIERPLSFRGLGVRNTLGVILDRDPADVSKSQISRFEKVLKKMLDDAESKI